MIYKTICVVTSIASFLVVGALEGGGLSAEQAAVMMVPVCVLMLWSFCRTDWHEPTRKKVMK